MIGHGPAVCSSLPAGWIDATAIEEIDRRLAVVAAQDARAILADAWVLLFALDALAGDGDLSAEEIELRLSQLVECASGHEVPEVAFDPVGIIARAVSARLEAAAPAALFEAWAARLGEVASVLLWEKIALDGRPTVQERADALAPAIDAAALALLAGAMPMEMPKVA